MNFIIIIFKKIVLREPDRALEGARKGVPLTIRAQQRSPRRGVFLKKEACIRVRNGLRWSLLASGGRFNHLSKSEPHDGEAFVRDVTRDRPRYEALAANVRPVEAMAIWAIATYAITTYRP